MAEDVPATIPQAAQAAARRWPDQPALIDGARQWSFAELWRDARRAAGAMIAHCVTPGARVAIWAPNSAEWLLAALGAHIAGAAIVPLNTRFKGAEAADILRRARVHLLVTPGEFLGQDYAAQLAGEALPDLAHTIAIDRDWAGFMASGDGMQPALVDTALATVGADTLSDIIFTSGTTGRPKGAMSAHVQVTRTFYNWAERVDLREGDRYLIVNPFFHTFGYKAGWVAALMRGATIIPMATFDVGAMAALIAEHRVSFIPGPPTIYQSLLEARGEEGAPDLSSLRVAVTGAAPVPPTMIERMRRELGMENIVNGYGMTECGVISMTCQGDDAETVANRCGLPMPGLEVRAVDEDGRDVPTGEAGELWVRGHSVMRGYLDDPQATAAAIDADGWLHTGDIGVIDERGYLRITDRKKDMFISGGFNVYPAEIEAVLNAHPDIAACAVIGIPDDRMGEVGHAFILPRAGSAPDSDDLAKWARTMMANYKVPRRLTLVTELPRNAAGKVLKDQLRDQH